MVVQYFVLARERERYGVTREIRLIMITFYFILMQRWGWAEEELGLKLDPKRVRGQMRLTVLEELLTGVTSHFQLPLLGTPHPAHLNPPTQPQWSWLNHSSPTPPPISSTPILFSTTLTSIPTSSLTLASSCSSESISMRTERDSVSSTLDSISWAGIWLRRMSEWELW